MYCSQCGERVESGHQFCGACGSPVRQGADDPHDQTVVEGVSPTVFLDRVDVPGLDPADEESRAVSRFAEAPDGGAGRSSVVADPTTVHETGEPRPGAALEELNPLIREAERELTEGSERKARGLLWKAITSATDQELEYVADLVRPLGGTDARELLNTTMGMQTSRAKRRADSAQFEQERATRSRTLRCVVTTDAVPGRQTVASLGPVWTAVVRDRNVVSDLGSDLKAVFGGELGGQTKELMALTATAVDRILDRALELGAHGVVGLRLVSPDTGRGSELVAYGTAVQLEPEAPDADAA